MKETIENEELTRLSEIYQQLSNRVRLQILLHLRTGAACVSELCEISGVSQSATSQHLKQLKATRLVKQERRAQQIYYSLVDDHVEKLLRNGIEHVKGAGCDENTK
ncbi:MAG: ArsR/SmtB family transcription factor [Culicoidibacterales bacterium]